MCEEGGQGKDAQGDGALPAKDKEEADLFMEEDDDKEERAFRDEMEVGLAQHVAELADLDSDAFPSFCKLVGASVSKLDESIAGKMSAVAARHAALLCLAMQVPQAVADLERVMGEPAVQAMKIEQAMLAHLSTLAASIHGSSLERVVARAGQSSTTDHGKEEAFVNKKLDALDAKLAAIIQQMGAPQQLPKSKGRGVAKQTSSSSYNDFRLKLPRYLQQRGIVDMSALRVSDLATFGALWERVMVRVFCFFPFFFFSSFSCSSLVEGAEEPVPSVVEHDKPGIGQLSLKAVLADVRSRVTAAKNAFCRSTVASVLRKEFPQLPEQRALVKVQRTRAEMDAHLATVTILPNPRHRKVLFVCDPLALPDVFRN